MKIIRRFVIVSKAMYFIGKNFGADHYTDVIAQDVTDHIDLLIDCDISDRVIILKSMQMAFSKSLNNNSTAKKSTTASRIFQAYIAHLSELGLEKLSIDEIKALNQAERFMKSIHDEINQNILDL